MARLLRAGLNAQPDRLTRWQCHPGWLAARAREPSQFRWSFVYPERPTHRDDKPWLQFERVIAVDDTPAAEQTARHDRPHSGSSGTPPRLRTETVRSGR